MFAWFPTHPSVLAFLHGMSPSKIGVVAIVLSDPGLAGAVGGQKMRKALNVKHSNFKLETVLLVLFTVLN